MSDSSSPARTLKRDLEFLANSGPRGFFYPPAQTIAPGVRSYLNHPFAMAPGYRLLRLDVHTPDSGPGPWPVIVYAGGGGWILVAKNHEPWISLLNEGYAVVSIEYRLSGEVHFPVQVHEVKAAIRWIRAHAADYCLDASRIVGWGCSAGGYLMAMAGATNGLQEFEGEVGEHLDRSSALAAVIAHYAPSDLATMGVDVDELPAPMMKMGTIDSPESRLLGYVPSTRPREAQYANVARYVSKDTVPMLLMHGDSDTLLPMKQSQRLYDALQKVGADVAFHCVRGANHAGPEFAEPEVIETVLDFLKRVLMRKVPTSEAATRHQR